MLPTDRELLSLCSVGDQDAWAKIVRRYERLLYSIAMREGLSSDGAADVTQYAFTELVRKLDSIADPERLGGWLATVARREAWRLRDIQRSAPGSSYDDDREVSQFVPDFEERLLEACEVNEAVQSLADPCRTLILSLFFDPAEPDYEAIAELIGRPVGSIGPMRARCLERLRGSLEGRDANV